MLAPVLSLPKGETFHAMAAVRPPAHAGVLLEQPGDGGGCGAVWGRQVAAQAWCSHLLALSSSRHVMLVDVRRPGAPLLTWRHQLDHEPPQLLQLLPAAFPAPQPGSGSGQGGESPHLRSSPGGPSRGPSQTAAGGSDVLGAGSPAGAAPGGWGSQPPEVLAATQGSQAPTWMGDGTGGDDADAGGRAPHVTPGHHVCIVAANTGRGDVVAFLARHRPARHALELRGGGDGGDVRRLSGAPHVQLVSGAGAWYGDRGGHLPRGEGMGSQKGAVEEAGSGVAWTPLCMDTWQVLCVCAGVCVCGACMCACVCWSGGTGPWLPCF